MRMFKRTQIAAMNKISGSLTNPVATGYNKGYFAGNDSSIDSIDKLDYSTDTNTRIMGYMSGHYSGSSVNSDSAGYIAGGYGSQRVSKVLFSTDVISNLSGQLPTVDSGDKGSVQLQGSNVGYLAGGDKNVFTIDKFTFATELGSNSGATLTAIRGDSFGLSSDLKGYFCGGYYYQTGYLSSIEALSFSTGSRTASSAVLSKGRGDAYPVNAPTKGYAVCGNIGSISSDTDKLLFATETSAIHAQTLSARYWGGGISNEVNGYIGGGRTQSASINSIVKLPFATELFATLSTTLFVQHISGCGISSS